MSTATSFVRTKDPSCQVLRIPPSMQDPAKEIASVFSLITMATSAEVQKRAIERYFTPDAGFKHPLCKVPPGPGSRSKILGIYQWYRVMSPRIIGDVKSVVYDPEQAIIILEIIQTFHIRISPLRPAPSRLIVRLTLEELGGLHYISSQEDFYHPEDLISLIFPPLIPLIHFLLLAATYLSNFITMLAHTVGITGMLGPAPSSSNEPAGESYESDSGLYDGRKAD